jgi:5-methylthioadenosine/S-adenosylhomocysteine deaminase
LKSAGVQLSIGTDGAQSNNTLDLLQDLKIGVLIQKQAAHDPKIFDVREAVRLATIEGAKALGMEGHIGSLEIGKQADLIAIDLRAPHVSPLVKDSVRDLYTTLVYCATGRDVTDTMVSGTWLMRDRNVLSMNPVEIMKECEKVRKDILRYIHKE